MEKNITISEKFTVKNRNFIISVWENSKYYAKDHFYSSVIEKYSMSIKNTIQNRIVYHGICTVCLDKYSFKDFKNRNERCFFPDNRIFLIPVYKMIQRIKLMRQTDFIEVMINQQESFL